MRRAAEPPSSDRLTGARSLPLIRRRFRGARRLIPGWGGSLSLAATWTLLAFFRLVGGFC